MRVGEVARRTGVTLRALRYYEKVRLVVPNRLPNGYREYEPVAVRQVEQIRELTGLGLPVEATRPFVECLGSGHRSGDECPSSMAAYRRAIAEFDERIARLVRCRDALAAHLDAAAGKVMRTAAAIDAQHEPDSRVDGSHLVGSSMPSVRLPSTDGYPVDLAALGPDWTVLYVYPLTGRPGVDLPEGWETIPGARGCTAEACGFRDHYEELREAGAARVFGLSTQAPDYQRELADRLRLPFVMLADPDLAVREALGLPTFTAAGMTLYQRLTMLVHDGVIRQVFFPVPVPDRHANEVVAWFQAHWQRAR